MKSILKKIYFSFFKIVIKLLIRSKIINFNTKLNKISKRSNIIYVLPTTSKIDLIILYLQCAKQGLPSPFRIIQISDNNLKSYILISNNYKKFFFDIKNIINSSIMIEKYFQSLYEDKSKLEIVIVLVSVILGRSPKFKNSYNSSNTKVSLLKNIIIKLFQILYFGRDTFIYFSQPISLKYLLKKIDNNKNIFIKLIKLARIFFIRQRLMSIGSILPVNKNLFNKLINSTNIKKITENESLNRKTSIIQSKKYVYKIIKEIASNFSYNIVLISERLLRCLWKRLYQKLNIFNIERIYKLSNLGHEIIYVPCHRSHMDYILLSYALYKKGLAIPYIAAGINLNIWPIGMILRKLGAFFIRRTFKNKKLYSVIFSQYLYELFTQRCSVEYFIEGKRSRTGLLLQPKTGLLNITIQSMLNNINKIITLVPVYIGYEQIIEVSNYTERLFGRIKKKKILHFLFKIKKINNLGQRYINFGNPLPLNQWLSQKFPKWHSSAFKKKSKCDRPYWLSIASNDIANYIMTNINNIAVVNTTNIFSIVLLTSNDYSLTRDQIISRIKFYLNLLKNVPYTKDTVIPNVSSEKILTQALLINKANIKCNKNKICLLKDKINIMYYYSNNIIHLLVIPSLLANLILNYPGINFSQLYFKITILFPLLKSELFLHYKKTEISSVMIKFINEFKCQGLVYSKLNKIYPIEDKIKILISLSYNINIILKRYAIIFYLLNQYPQIDKNLLEKKSIILMKKTFDPYNESNDLEYFYKNSISNLISILLNKNYIKNNSKYKNKQIKKILNTISEIVDSKTFNDIKNIALSFNLKC